MKQCNFVVVLYYYSHYTVDPIKLHLLLSVYLQLSVIYLVKRNP